MTLALERGLLTP